MNAGFGTDQRLNGSLYQFTSIGTPRKDRPFQMSGVAGLRGATLDDDHRLHGGVIAPGHLQDLGIDGGLPRPRRDQVNQVAGPPVRTGNKPRLALLCHYSQPSPRPSQRLMTVKGDLTLFIVCIRCDVWWVFKGEALESAEEPAFGGSKPCIFVSP